MYIAVFIRPIFMITNNQSLWRTFRTFALVVWESKEIICLYISYIVMFGWIAYWLFWGTVEGASVCPDLETCCWNLLI